MTLNLIHLVLIQCKGFITCVREEQGDIDSVI